MLFRRLCYLIVFFCFASSPRAQSPLMETAIHDHLPARLLVDIMAEEDYLGEIDEDGDIVWRLHGYHPFLVFGDNNASITFVVAVAETDATWQKVNDWNRTKKYSRSYLDDDGDPVLELDLDMVGGVTPARIKDYLLTCDISLRTWINEVL